MPSDTSSKQLPVYLEGLAVRYFRGIGPDQQKLGPFKGFNFFVGANNSGKSTILDFIHRYLGAAGKIKTTADRIDRYTGEKAGELDFAIGRTLNRFTRAVLDQLNPEMKNRFQDKILAICRVLAEPDSMIWIVPTNGPVISQSKMDRLRSLFNQHEWHSLWANLKQMQGGDFLSHWIPQTVSLFYNAQPEHLPSIGFIPTHRQIGDTSDQFDDFSGRGLIARLYVRAWLHSVDPNLVEGIHYSIMFYGGRLLSHLSAQDDEVTEFIRLRSLNQKLGVVMDSDKASSHAKVNDTKLRVSRELSQEGALAWITKGREIENYVPFDVLQNAVKEVYAGRYHSAPEQGHYSHALHYWPIGANGKRARNLETRVDKVRVAKLVVKGQLDLGMLDLRRNIEDLAARIQRANS